MLGSGSGGIQMKGDWKDGAGAGKRAFWAGIELEAWGESQDRSRKSGNARKMELLIQLCLPLRISTRINLRLRRLGGALGS